MDARAVECQIEREAMNDEAPPTPLPWTTPEGWRARLARVQRPELEQAVLRVVLVTLVYVYVLWFVHRDGSFEGTDLEFVSAGAGFVTLALGLLVRVLASGGHSTPRRALGMLADNAATTYCLIRMDESGAFVLGVYLFVAFGNGFRFGRAWLHASQAIWHVPQCSSSAVRS